MAYYQCKDFLTEKVHFKKKMLLARSKELRWLRVESCASWHLRDGLSTPYSVVDFY